MKILIDNQIFENQKFGGINRYFNELQRDNDVLERMELYQPKSPIKKSFYHKVKDKILPPVVSPGHSKPHKYDFYREQLKDRDFDIFHPTYYDNYFLEQLTKPFVLTVHDMIHEKYAEYFGNSQDSFNKRNLCNAAAKIIAVSHTTKNDLIDIFGMPEEKIKVIYHATNFNSVTAIEPNLNFEGSSYILFTGTRDIYKNFLTFLIAVAPILKNHKELHLICTGSNFTTIEKKWIEEMDLSTMVFSYFCQNDGELVHLYKNAECFIFPSLYEGFGFPLLEAFACECPVITSSGGSLREIAGNAAVYFHPKNIREMRQSIINVLSDKILQEDLVAAGKKRLQDFSWDKCRKETNTVYANVV